MQLILFRPGDAPTAVAPGTPVPESGFLWIDADREPGRAWLETLERQAGLELHEQHRTDLCNVEHPSFFDATGDYEMVIFRSLASTPGEDDHLKTRANVMLMTPRLLLTVHEPGSRSVAAVRERLLAGQGRVPRRPVGLMHLLQSAVVDRFLEIREPLDAQLATTREELLDPRHPYNDWQALLRFGSRLRRLELLCEEQADALQAWEAATSAGIDDHLAVRLRDLREHIERVRRFAEVRQQDVDSMVQLHFSAVAHRTNDIMRVLTVISAIFLPLSLVAGIFGMNFAYMPELQLRYAYFVALGAMAALGIGLFALFKIKRWV